MTPATLVVVPTYNERDNLPLLIDGLMRHDNVRMLVVDDPVEYQAWLKERAELSGSAPAPAPGAPTTVHPSGEPEAKAAEPSTAPSPSGH